MVPVPREFLDEVPYLRGTCYGWEIICDAYGTYSMHDSFECRAGADLNAV